MRRIDNIKGLHVAVTGAGALARSDILRLIRNHGGRTSDRGRVTNETRLLIRGHSANWVSPRYGAKERKIAALIRAGRDAAVVDESAFMRFIKHGTPMSRRKYVSGWRVDDLREEARAVEILGGKIESRQPTDIGKLIKRLAADPVCMRRGRAEQALLRAMLFGGIESTCDVCGRKLPTSLLVASHIKPRAKCSPRERLDIPAIAMRACLLGCDALYERGLVAVAPGGRIVVASAIGKGKGAQAIRNQYRQAKCRAYGSKTERYFEWHLRHVFQG